jgi:hypothetical protein
MPDQILLELWRVKDELAAQHDHDIKKFVRYLRLKERERRTDPNRQRAASPAHARRT